MEFLLGLPFGAAIAALVAVWMWDEATFRQALRTYEREKAIHEMWNRDRALVGLRPIPLGGKPGRP